MTEFVSGIGLARACNIECLILVHAVWMYEEE
jgi:hypothetical protein